MEKIPFSLDDITLELVDPASMPDLSDFSCGVKDLDDFFHHEVLACITHHYLAAYIVKIKDEIAAIFTLMNDALMITGPIEKKDFIDDLQWETADVDVDFLSRQTSYPAINIGHLGVSTNWQGSNLGSIVLTYVASTFSSYKNAGCQFLTVDAINNGRTTKFYAKNDFSFQTLKDSAKSTRRMYRIL